MTRILALLCTAAVLSAFGILFPIENGSAGVPYLPKFPSAENRSVIPIFCSNDSRAACYKVRSSCMRNDYIKTPPGNGVHCQRDYQACLSRCGGDPRGPGHGD
jgi:hypothetical protein